MVKNGLHNRRAMALGICLLLGSTPLCLARRAQALRSASAHPTPGHQPTLRITQAPALDSGLEPEIPGEKPLPAPNPAESLPEVGPPPTPKGQTEPSADFKPSRPISARKSALIDQLLVITDQRQIAEDQFNFMLADMEKNLPEMLSVIMGDRSDLQDQDLLAKVTETSQRMVQQYREKLSQRVNIGDISEQISRELYDKYYTEAELKDLIVFYKTPTGKKTITTLPQLSREALERSNAILLPEITQLLQEIMEQELGNLPLPAS